MPSPIWITGAGGLIGGYLVQSAPEHAPGATVIGLTRAHLDLNEFSAVRSKFRQQHPQLVIHCAAISKSAQCQADPATARRMNVELTSLLAELAAAVPLIFFSTDLVFDGRAGNYDESAAPNPLSLYGETKAQAEQIILANPRHTVVRTSINGGTSRTGDHGFNEEMRRAWQAGQTVRLFADEFRSPIPARVTARAVWELAALDRPGLYHIAGAERLSRWQIGELLAARWPQLRPKMEATSRKEYRGAPRPADTSLYCGKVQKLLSFSLPGLTDWLAAHPQEEF